MTDWVRQLRELDDRDEPCVLVTVARVKGSAPREAGAKMLVTADAIRGTIGGGTLEYQAIGHARELLAAGPEGEVAGPRVKGFALGPDLGQCCGGAATLVFEPARAGDWLGAVSGWADQSLASVLVTVVEAAPDSGLEAGAKVALRPGQWRGPALPAAWEEKIGALAAELLPQGDGDAGGFPRLERLRTDGSAARTRRDGSLLLFEPVRPVDFNIVLFGAGHVGRAVAAVLAEVRCNLTWVDERAGQFPSLPQDCAARIRPALRYDVATLPTGAYCLVMSHSHDGDLEICAQVLRQGGFRFLGLIGSQTKKRRFLKRLGDMGLDEATIARMTCPIGIAGIDGKQPGEIAVAAAAQLLRLRYGHQERREMATE